MLPALNFTAPGLLIGLCYRCLAGAADEADAALTRRRLEDLRAEATALGLDLSGTRADLQIARDKARSAARELEDAEVDLRLFDEQQPPPPKRAGLLKGRANREAPAVKSRRQELKRLLELARDAARRGAAGVEQLAVREQELIQHLKSLQDRQQELAAGLRRQYCAAVLELCARGEWRLAEVRVLDLRQTLRGELAVAVLAVLCRLFEQGPAAGRQALLEARAVLENHPPPARRVLEALLAYAEGARLERSELSLILPDQLEWDGLYQLYQTVAVLSGWRAEQDGAASGITPTLRALETCRAAIGAEPETVMTSGALAELARSQDVVVRALCAHRALLNGDLAAVLDCAGIEPDAADRGRRRREPPPLMERIRRLAFPAWPAALQDEWRALLCCQVLLAANPLLERPLFAQWLAESYGWPKSDFYWWVLMQVKQDAALERNLARAPGQLVMVARI